MKLSRFIIFAIASFFIALLSSLNYLGILLSIFSSDLSSYLVSGMTGVFLIVNLLIFYFIGQKFTLNKSIVFTIILIYGYSIIGYFIGWLILFQMNPMYHLYYGDTIYLEALFITILNSIPVALAAFSGLAIAYIQNTSHMMKEGTALKEVGDNAKTLEEVHEEEPVIEGEESESKKVPQNIDSEDEGEF